MEMDFNQSLTSAFPTWYLSSVSPNPFKEPDPGIIQRIEMMKYFTYTPVVSLFVILGLFGNSCIIAVCMIQRTLSTGYTFIGFLALSDLISCLAMTPWPLVHLLAIAHHWPFAMTYGWNFFLIRVCLIVVNTFMKFSALLTCALSLDRYVALHYPHRYLGMSKKYSYTRIIISVCFFIALGLMIPRVKKFEIASISCLSLHPESPLHSRVVKAATIDINHPLDLEGPVMKKVGLRDLKQPYNQAKNSSQPNCYTFMINKEYHSSRLYWYYKWWREIVLTVIPLILLFVLNINIVYKYKSDIMKKKLSMTLPPTATDIQGTDYAGAEIENGSLLRYLRRKSTRCLSPYSRTTNPYQRRKTLDQTSSSFTIKKHSLRRNQTVRNGRVHKSASLAVVPNDLASSTVPLLLHTGGDGSHINYNDPNRSLKSQECKNSSIIRASSNSPISYSNASTGVTTVIVSAEKNDLNHRPLHKRPCTLSMNQKVCNILPDQPTSQPSKNGFDMKLKHNDTPACAAEKRSLDKEASVLKNEALTLTTAGNNGYKYTHELATPKSTQPISMYPILQPDMVSTTSYNPSARNSLKKRIIASIRPSLISVGFRSPRTSVISEKQRRYAKDERNLTLMLIITVLQHLICTAPQAVITMFDSAERRKISIPLECTFLVTNCLEALNYVLNFYIYTIFVKDFRLQFKKICRNALSKFKARCNET